MKTLFTKIIAIALIAGSSFAFAELEIGADMPKSDLAMTNVDGKQLTLSEVTGKNGTVVAFWCNHCPWVVKWRERLVDISNEYSKEGFGFVAINSNDPAKVKGDSLGAMKEYATKYKYNFPYLVDKGSVVAKAFGATKTPHIYVFDAKGKLVYVGAIDDNANNADKVTAPYLRNALDAIAKGESVAKTNSKAMGCGVKFYN